MPVQALADASQSLYTEIGVVQNTQTGKLTAILGVSPISTIFKLEPNEIIVSHVHPSWEVEESELGGGNGDIANARYLESVIDWSGNILYYDNMGVVDAPETGFVNSYGYFVGRR